MSTTERVMAKNEAPLRLSLPEGDVILSDGRTLVLEEQTDFVFTVGIYNRYSGPQGLSVMASVEPTAWGLLLHVSVSHLRQLTDWRAMRTIRDAFYPAHVDVMVIFPRDGDYCLHFWQAPWGWGKR